MDIDGVVGSNGSTTNWSEIDEFDDEAMGMIRQGAVQEEVMVRKGPWMPEEDEILVEYVRQYGPRDWSSIRSKGLLPRTGKSCRLRWVNKLKPDLKRSGCKFSPEEEKLVVEMQTKLGNKWAKIASYLPGRTDNDVKNFWSTRQKRLMRASQPSKSQISGKDSTKDAFFNEFPPLQVCSLAMQRPPHFLASHWSSPFNDLSENNSNETYGEMQNQSMAGTLDDRLMAKLQDILNNDSQSGLINPESRSKEANSINIRNNNHSSRRSSTKPYNSARSKKDHMQGMMMMMKKMNRGNGGFDGLCNLNMDMEMDMVGGILAGDSSLLQSSSYDYGMESIIMHDQFKSSYSNPNDDINYGWLHLGSSMENEEGIKVLHDDHFSASLTNATQWERLPSLSYPDEPHRFNYADCSHIKEEIITSDSVSPDSVLKSSTMSCTDCQLFDSLEPLSSTTPDWWASNDFASNELASNDLASNDLASNDLASYQLSSNEPATNDNIISSCYHNSNIVSLVKSEPHEHNHSC